MINIAVTPTVVEAQGYVPQPVTYMQSQVVNQPIVGQQSYVIQQARNPEVIVNQYDLNQPKPPVLPQAPVVTFQQPYKYPVTYKMGAPKIRPPTQIQEETTVVKAPVQQVVTQPYIQNQPMLVQQPVTQYVPQRVSQQYIVPQAIPLQPSPMAYDPQFIQGAPAYY